MTGLSSPETARGGLRKPAAPARLPRALRRLPRIVAGGRRWMMVKLLACALGKVLAALALVWHLRRLPGGGAVQAGAGLDTSSAVGLLASGLLLFALSVRERREAETLGQDYVSKVRLRLFAVLGAEPGDRVSDHRLGVTMTRMIGDLASLKSWVSRGVAGAAAASVSLLGAGAALFLLAPAAAWVAGAMTMLTIVVLAASTGSHRRNVRAVRRSRGRLAGHLGEVLPLLPDIAGQAEVGREWRRLRRRGARLARASVSRATTAAVPLALPDAVVPGAAAALVWLAASGTLAWNELAGALALTGFCAGALRDLGRAWHQRIAFAEARRRLSVVLTEASRTRRRTGRRRLARPRAAGGSGAGSSPAGSPSRVSRPGASRMPRAS